MGVPSAALFAALIVAIAAAVSGRGPRVIPRRAGVAAHKNVNPVWANYRLIGTVWEPPNSLKPGQTGPAMVKSSIGSVDLANSTMETYVQGTGRNCFMCHNTGQGPSTGMPQQPIQAPPLFPAKNINLSHVLLGPFFAD